MLVFMFSRDCPSARRIFQIHIWTNPKYYIQEKYSPPLNRLLEVEV